MNGHRAPDFYMGSMEHTGDLGRPRACRSLGRVVGRTGADFLRIEVDPPFEGSSINREGRLSEVVVSPHFEGDTLFPIRAYPVSVYVYAARRAGALTREPIEADDVEVIAWAELYDTAEAAAAAAKNL